MRTSTGFIDQEGNFARPAKPVTSFTSADDDLSIAASAGGHHLVDLAVMVTADQGDDVPRPGRYRLTTER